MNKEGLALKTVRAALLLALVEVASGQVFVTAKPKQPQATPAAQPEPRMPIEGDPLVIFQNLIGSSSANRRVALNQLGWKEEEKYAEDKRVIGDARFYRVNLDDDDEMEAIMWLNVGLGGTRVLVFKKSDTSWWQIGSFTLCCRFAPDEAEHMLEMRNIVDFHQKDIIIRLAGGGTDIQKAIQLSVYRVFQGRLYRTFQTTEEFAVRRFPRSGEMVIEDERHQIAFPETVHGKDPFIVLRSTKESTPEAKWSRDEGNPTLIDCVPYRWDAATYSFVADRSATLTFCGVGARRQKQRGRQRVQ